MARDPFYSGAASAEVQGGTTPLSDFHSYNNTQGGSANAKVLGSGIGGAASGFVTSASQTVQAIAIATEDGSVQGGISGGGANGYIDYYLTVTGTSYTDVPIIATGYLLANAGSNGGTATSQAEFSVYSPDGYTGGSGYVVTNQTADALLYCDSGPAQSSCGRQDFTVDFNLLPGNTAVLYLSAEAGAGMGDGTSTVSGSAQAQTLADPYFMIDPTFLAANPGFQLHFSAGVTNIPAAVPEAGTWEMLIAGFAVVGGALRARRRSGLVVA